MRSRYKTCDATQTFYPSAAWASEVGQGVLTPLDFEICSKKGCFLSFEWEKPKFITFDPPENFWKIH